MSLSLDENFSKCLESGCDINHFLTTILNADDEFFENKSSEIYVYFQTLITKLESLIGEWSTIQLDALEIRKKAYHFLKQNRKGG